MGSRCYLSSLGECIWQQRWFMRLREKNTNRIFSPAKMDKTKRRFLFIVLFNQINSYDIYSLMKGNTIGLYKRKNNKIIYEKTAGFFALGITLSLVANELLYANIL